MNKLLLEQSHAQALPTVRVALMLQWQCWVVVTKIVTHKKYLLSGRVQNQFAHPSLEGTSDI